MPRPVHHVAMRSSASVPLFVAVALLSGCGGDSSGPVAPPAPPPPPPAPVVATVELTAPASVTAAGGILQLQATAKTATGAPVPTATFAWSSSAAAVATVDNTGRVRGVTAGPVTITATSAGVTGAVQLTVRDTAALPQQIAGEVRRVSLTIPPGAVHQVTANTVLWADSTLTIDGSLELHPGASLRLYGRRVVISGVVRPSAGAGLRFGDSPMNTTAPRGDVLVAGLDLLLSGSIASPGSIFLGSTASTPVGGSLVVRGDLIAGDGAAGTTLQRHGEDGGDVISGGPRMPSDFGTVPTLPLRLFESIEIETPMGQANPVTIRGGHGGAGFDIVFRSDAELISANVVHATAGNGGDGGYVAFYSGDPSEGYVVGSPEPLIKGGDGGAGGWLILSGQEKLRDGSGPSNQGESLDGTTGDGGGAGHSSLAGFSGGAEQSGAPGASGSAVVAGGNGTSGGAGGSIQLRIGNSADPLVPRPAVHITDAVDGGASSAPTVPGGEGGTVSIQSRGGPGPAADLAVIELVRVGRGGAGFNGCAMAPLGPGSAGGDAGRRDLKGLVALGAQTFNGGRGGDGLGLPGPGGDEGLDAHTGQPIGSKGPNGVDCAGLIFIGTSTAVFNVSKGTPCVPSTQPTGTISITSPLPANIPFVATVQDLTGTSGITLLPNPAVVGSQTVILNTSVSAGSTRTIGYHFNPCTASSTFSGRVILTFPGTAFIAVGLIYSGVVQ